MDEFAEIPLRTGLNYNVDADINQLMLNALALTTPKIHASTAAAEYIGRVNRRMHIYDPSADHDVVLDDDFKFGDAVRVKSISPTYKLNVKSSALNSIKINLDADMEFSALQDTPTTAAHWLLTRYVMREHYARYKGAVADTGATPCNIWWPTYDSGTPNMGASGIMNMTNGQIVPLVTGYYAINFWYGGNAGNQHVSLSSVSNTSDGSRSFGLSIGVGNFMGSGVFLMTAGATYYIVSSFPSTNSAVNTTLTITLVREV